MKTFTFEPMKIDKNPGHNFGTVPQSLIDQIGTKTLTPQGEFYISGYIPSWQPKLNKFFIYGVKAKAPVSQIDFDQWKHVVTLRNEGACVAITGMLIGDTKLKSVPVCV